MESPASELHRLYQEGQTLAERARKTYPTLRLQEEAANAHAEFAGKIRKVKWLVEVASVSRSGSRFQVFANVESSFLFWRQIGRIYIHTTQDCFNGISLLDLRRGQNVVIVGSLSGLPSFEQDASVGTKSCYSVHIDLESLALP